MKGVPAYVAVPEGSVLLARLRSDAPFSRTVAALYSVGYLPFDLLRGDTGLIAGVLASEGFPVPPGEIMLHVREAMAELARTERVFPGTSENYLRLEIDPELLEKRLTDYLERDYLERESDDAAGKLVIMLLYGAGRLAPAIFREQDPQLYLVPLPAVRYGAGRLERIRSEELFPGDDFPAIILREQFESWRGFYAGAARRGEPVLVYIG